jgi:hypothetical protein
MRKHRHRHGESNKHNFATIFSALSKNLPLHMKLTTELLPKGANGGKIIIFTLIFIIFLISCAGVGIE